MKSTRWAAIAVTALFVLFNLGAAFDSDQETWIKVGGAVLAVLGLIAAAAWATGQAWGRAAVIGVGALNIAAAVGALVSDEPGGGIGIVVGGMAVVLALLAGQGTARTEAAS